MKGFIELNVYADNLTRKIKQLFNINHIVKVEQGSYMHPFESAVIYYGSPYCIKQVEENYDLVKKLIEDAMK